MRKQVQQRVKWFSSKRGVLLTLFFSMALLGTAIFLLASKNNRLKNEFVKQERHLQQKEAFEKLSLYIKTAESSIRGYAISGDKKFIEKFDPAID